MSKLAIITSEAITVNKNGCSIPCVVVVGRDEENNKRMWRKVVYPYLYLQEKDYLNFGGLEGFSIDRFVKEALGTKLRTLNKKILTKIVLRDYKDVDNIKTFLKKTSKVKLGDFIYTYEADLCSLNYLNLRWLIDNNIRSGMEIKGDGSVFPVDLDANLRTWLFDLEVYTHKICSIGMNDKCPITMFTWYDNYEDCLYTYYVINNSWKRKPIFRKKYKNHIIKGFTSEPLFLDAIKDMVVSQNPDLFTAWNIDRYDVPKWIKRMKFNHLDPKSLSPLKRIVTSRMPYRIKGRIVFDMMESYRKFTASDLRSYSLLGMIKEEGFTIEKVPFRGSAGETWDEYPEVVFKRNVNDVLVLKELNDKYELIEMFDDLRKEFGLLWNEIFLNHRVVDTALLRFISGKIALGTPNILAEKGERYLGASIDAVPGKYKFLAEFDFSREYPHVIKALNIGPETYRSPEYTGECYTIKYRDAVYKFVKKPKSLMSQLITYFFRKRDEYEAEYVKAIERGDEKAIKKWWRRIFNIKTITNSIYGVMDYTGFRLYRQECSAATAVVARMGLEKVIDVAKEMGLEVVYQHTDSVFINLKSNNIDDALVEAQGLAGIFNKKLSEYFVKELKIEKHPSELSLKRVYDNMIIITRTQSAGSYLYDEKKGRIKDLNYYKKQIEKFITYTYNSINECNLKWNLENVLYVGNLLNMDFIQKENIVRNVQKKHIKTNKKNGEGKIRKDGINLRLIGEEILKKDKDMLENLKKDYYKKCGVFLGKNVKDVGKLIKECWYYITKKEQLKGGIIQDIIQKNIGMIWKYYVLIVIELLIMSYDNQQEREFDFTGLEVVRSDSSDVEKEVLETLIKMILSEKKHKEINQYWEDVKRKFLSRDYDAIELAYPLQIKYMFRHYGTKDKNGKPKTIPAHIRAALVSNKVLNTDYESGDKPRRLPIKSKEKFVWQRTKKEKRTFDVTDISITEDVEIPDKYKKAIDYDRIFERLSSKVEKILNLIYIQKTLM